MVSAPPVCGKMSLSKSIQPGEWFSTAEMARASARPSPERIASIKVERLASKLLQCKAG
jgi:hypothetical protein